MCVVPAQDYAVFYTLEVAWTGHYDAVYYAYSLHGVLGHVLALVITINLLAPMHVLQTLGSLHAFTSACLVVSLCYTVKEFYLRRPHKPLLNVRLKHNADGRVVADSLQTGRFRRCCRRR